MSLAVISGGKNKTSEKVTGDTLPFFRYFIPREGTSVYGTWVWAANSNQTNFLSLANDPAGYWYNTAGYHNDKYKVTSLFLIRGIYKITIIHYMNNEAGIAEVRFGTKSLGMKDFFYNGSSLYNQTWEITFVVEKDQLNDLVFLVNGHNILNLYYYYINFSRFQIEKIG